MKKIFATLAVIGLAFASVTISKAQSYYLAGDYQGSSWSPNANQMDAGPGAGEYTLTISNQTAGSFAYVRVTDGTWNNQWPNSQALRVKYDNNGSATIHFYPGISGDGWLPLANRVGYDDPGNLTSWGMAGAFDGWDGTQKILASIGSGVYSNSIVVASAGTGGFKFQSPAGDWTKIYFGSDFGNNGSDGSITTTNSPQTLPVVLDLPNGRYLVGSLAPKPITNYVVFAVDMTSQMQIGKFDPSVDNVFVSGAFNGWPGTGAGALVLTNYPAYNGGSNTNIYYGTNIFIGLPNSSSSGYKFTCNDPNTGNNGYEGRGSDRSFNLLATSGTITLPAVSFGDFYASDYLTADTLVTFSVDMTNLAGGYMTGTDGHTFNPSTDNVYINGQFANYGGQPQSWYPWAPLTGLNPPPPSPYQLYEVGFSSVYTNTFTIPAGTPIQFHYKYGIDTNNLGAGVDDEAGSYIDHVRVIRSTVASPYVLPTDNFRNMYVEPFFTSSSTAGGNLSVGQPVSGKIPVTWLGRPGAYLQYNTNLLGGTWQDLIATDGTNWTTGFSSINGFVSQTNWPAGNNTYFRLVRP